MHHDNDGGDDAEDGGGHTHEQDGHAKVEADDNIDVDRDNHDEAADAAAAAAAADDVASTAADDAAAAAAADDVAHDADGDEDDDLFHDHVATSHEKYAADESDSVYPRRGRVVLEGIVVVLVEQCIENTEMVTMRRGCCYQSIAVVRKDVQHQMMSRWCTFKA